MIVKSHECNVDLLSIMKLQFETVWFKHLIGNKYCKIKRSHPDLNTLLDVNEYFI